MRQTCRQYSEKRRDISKSNFQAQLFGENKIFKKKKYFDFEELELKMEK